MVALKHVLAFLASATAFAAANPLAANNLDKRVCVPPGNCGGPVGDCEFCCGGGSPDSSTCHSHGSTCGDGTPLYHCDDASR